MKVRVRIAPSPTGLAHIGNAYMGLFNWVFAQKHKGTFVLRLDDTDQKRHIPQAEQVIYRAFDWLGLTPNESPIHGGNFGPYRQSERLETYQKIAAKLKKNRQAYEKDGAIWFKMPQTGKFSWLDKVRGQITFDTQNLKDWVIVKSDRFPTYNFASTVDDFKMKITHVIRGEEHVSNTPLQLALLQALKLKPPTFAHLPTLRNKNHKKLSKRRDPVSLTWFKQEGYLPNALTNFLALQGWSHPEEKDIFDLKEFTNKFSLNRIKTSAPIFDFNKLNWINGSYIRKLSSNQLISQIQSAFAPRIPQPLIAQTVPLIKDRLQKLSEYPELVKYFIHPPVLNQKLIIKQSKNGIKEIINTLEQVKTTYEKTNNWNTQELETTGHKLLKITGWTPRQLFMTIRVVISGHTATPPLFETMQVMGKEEVISRLETAIKSLK